MNDESHPKVAPETTATKSEATVTRSFDVEIPAALRRRRAASWRTELLASGHRDPLDDLAHDGRATLKRRAKPGTTLPTADCCPRLASAYSWNSPVRRDCEHMDRARLRRGTRRHRDSRRRRALPRAFVAFPSDAAQVAVTLWAAHTHLLDCFESTPRLAVLSPEPGSGKTRVLEILELLTPRVLFTLNASSAALFRKVADGAGRPTVLIDEADTIFGPRAAKEHEDLRGFVNGGHRRGAMAIRCVVKGKTIDVEEYPCYTAVALAGLDDLPDAIMSRSVVIRMRRRAPDEHVEPFRRRVDGPGGDTLRDRLATWAADVAPKIDGAWPTFPDGIEDRSADVWEALLAIADAAGGD